MASSPAPCGTRAAYNRHLRKNETPCDACRKANTAAKRRQRDEALKPKAKVDPEEKFRSLPVPELTEDGSRLGYLRDMRAVLLSAMRYAAADDPIRVGNITKELRAVLVEIDELEGASSKPEGADPLDSFLAGNVVGITEGRKSS